jgi:hypothetical protein
MALFDKNAAKDPYGFLGMDRTKLNTHTPEGTSGGYGVGSDITSQPKGLKPNPPTPPGISPIKRQSMESRDYSSEGGYLVDKLERHEVGGTGKKWDKVDTEDKYASGLDQADSKRTIESKYDETKYTGPNPTNKEFGKATEDLTNFKKLYGDALGKLNVNSKTAILNDTKDPSVLSMLAAGRGDMISSLAPEPKINMTGNLSLGRAADTSDQEYYDNLAKKYDKKYDHHTHHLNKKKLPNYSSTDQSLRIDGYNKKSVTDNNIISEYSFRHEDLIPMYFHDLVNKKFLPFRSFINSVSEGSDATWTEVNYLGRADKVYVYAGFTRTLTLDFSVQAFSVEELFPMWQRVNYLVGLTMPAAYTGSTETPSAVDKKNRGQSNIGTSSPSAFIIPPFVKFRLGDMYRNQPVIITNVGTTVPPEASWELFSNEHGAENNYDYLNKTIERNNVRSAQYPTMVTMSVSMTLLEKRAPQTVARHFGDSTVESVHPTEDNSLPRGDFNHQLIHFGKDENSPELEPGPGDGMSE